MWRLTDNYRRTLISPNFNQGVEAARPVSPLNGSYHKVSTVAPFLLDYSGLLPIPGHVIGVSRRRRRGSGICRFGAKETQPISLSRLHAVIERYNGYGIFTLYSHWHKLFVDIIHYWVECKLCK